MKKSKAALGVVAVTMAAVATLFLLPAKKQPPAQTAVIGKGTMAQTILLEGTVGYKGERMEVSLVPGRVKQVAVKKGQHVEAGQLLIMLDTSAEAEQLEKLQGEWSALSRAEADTPKGLMSMLRMQELEITIAQTEASLALKQIRAQEAGIVGDVYLSEGQMVEAGQALVSIHSGEMCVVVNAEKGEAAGWKKGSRATVFNNGKAVGARLWQTGQLLTDGSAGKAYQQCFFALDETLPLGQKVTVELEKGLYQEAAMIPLCAMDAEGCIWTVEKEGLERRQVTPLWLEGDLAGVEEAVAGAVVILQPEEHGLYPGRKTGEAKEENHAP